MILESSSVVQWFGVERPVDVVFVGGLGDFSDEMDWIRGGFCSAGVRIRCDGGVKWQSSDWVEGLA